MRGKSEDLRRGEGAPLKSIFELAGKSDAVTDGERLGERFEVALPADLVRAGDDEVPVGMFGQRGGKGLDEDVGAFFGWMRLRQMARRLPRRLGKWSRNSSRPTERSSVGPKVP
jgi:hypothetical protein